MVKNELVKDIKNGIAATSDDDFSLSQCEEIAYRAAYKHAEGNQTKIAEILDVSRGTCRNKLKAYGLL